MKKKKLEEILRGVTIKATKDATFKLYKPFFYDIEKLTGFIEKVNSKLSDNGYIIDVDYTVINTHRKFVPFRGGDTVVQGSHYHMEIKFITND